MENVENRYGKTSIIGEVFDTNNYGKVKVLEKLDIIGRPEPVRYINGKAYHVYGKDFYLIEFLDTGFRTQATWDVIKSGALKDRFVPSVCNVGFSGDACYRSGNQKRTLLEENLYQVWNDMIKRCYSEINVYYKNYGGAGVSVDQRWFNFSNFFFDVQRLPGFMNKLNSPSYYQLDKDYLQMGIPRNKKVYSQNTCIWLTAQDNVVIKEACNGNPYFGVCYKYSSWATVINYNTWGRFKTPEAAACLFNYIYPSLKLFKDGFVPYNNVPMLTLDQLKSQCINKNIWIENPELIKIIPK